MRQTTARSEPAALLLLASLVGCAAWGCASGPEAAPETPAVPTAGAAEMERSGRPAHATEASRDDGLEAEVAQRYRVAREQRRLLAARLRDEARARFLAGDAERALVSVNHALRLDPSAGETQALAARIRNAVDGSGATDEVTLRETARREAARSRAESEVRSLLQRGDAAMVGGDPTTAVRCYADALLILRATPIDAIEADGIETRLEAARRRLPARR